MTSNATATHRVFEAIQGLWPVTAANVREADPEALLDLFEGAENTRDLYFDEVISYMKPHDSADVAAELWADALAIYETDHDDDCDDALTCLCKQRQWQNNRDWGQELYGAIQQRIRQLND